MHRHSKLLAGWTRAGAGATMAMIIFLKMQCITNDNSLHANLCLTIEASERASELLWIVHVAVRAASNLATSCYSMGTMIVHVLAATVTAQDG